MLTNREVKTKGSRSAHNVSEVHANTSAQVGLMLQVSCIDFDNGRNHMGSVAIAVDNGFCDGGIHSRERKRREREERGDKEIANNCNSKVMKRRAKIVPDLC